jgi:glycosyltransferase involved in cell wall biosynthesis
MRKISIITPCYNEELNVDECYKQVRALFNVQLNRYDYEHIFCDNSSTDRTVDRLHAIAKLGSGLIDYSQKMTTAAMQIADMKVWAHRS